MKKLVLVLLLLFPVVAQASENTVRLYNRSGSYQGQLRTDSHGTTRYYDKSGRYTGRASTSSSGIRFYDRSGKYLGIVK